MNRNNKVFKASNKWKKLQKYFIQSKRRSFFSTYKHYKIKLYNYNTKNGERIKLKSLFLRAKNGLLSVTHMTFICSWN